jgi:hypothetical protein
MLRPYRNIEGVEESVAAPPKQGGNEPRPKGRRVEGAPRVPGS